MPEPSDPPEDLTTVHVHRAADGDRESLSWLLARFTPLLLSQAHYRLGTNLRRVYDPEDLVNDVWAIALPRLSGLPMRDGRLTPVVLKFLSTTLLYRFNTIARKRIHGATSPNEASPSTPGDPMDDVVAETRGVVTRVIESETRREVTDAIAALDDTDREILILRGMEQNPIPFIASKLAITENAVYARYHRALKKLRQELRESVFDEFPEAD